MSTDEHETKYDCHKADTIEYMTSEAHFGAEGVSVPGACSVCGATFEFYYDKVGVWDPEDKKYVKEF